jgi:ribonuclease HI
MVQFPASSSLGAKFADLSTVKRVAEDDTTVPKKVKKAKKMVVPPVTTPSNLVVYTDGAHSGGLAGIGIYFGCGDKRNIGAPLPGNPQTSQRAELYAAVRCLETSPTDTNLTVVTDSQYLVGSMTDWLPGWIRNKWHKADGSPVLNTDLIKRLLELVALRKNVGKSVTWFKVPAHSGIFGNEEADRLANAGVDAARAQRRAVSKV